MPSLFSKSLLCLNRTDYFAAIDLMAQFGIAASDEAKVRAHLSRDRGNIIRYCAWRQVERVIRLLNDDAVTGTVH